MNVIAFAQAKRSLNEAQRLQRKLQKQYPAALVKIEERGGRYKYTVVAYGAK